MTPSPLAPVVGALPEAVLNGTGPLAQLMRDAALHIVLQPIIDMRDGSVYAHEALIRGPENSPLRSADALLGAARSEGLLFEFEFFCVLAALRRWSQLDEQGRLFVNISADALVIAVLNRARGAWNNFVADLGLLQRRLVLEITEHERVADMAALVEAVKQVHAMGISLALDDFGDGRSSLRLWSQLRPDIVKIDKYFTANISNNADNVLTLRALLQIAQTFNTMLVAEGIETQEDARVIRDLGIRYGQGYLFGRPARTSIGHIEAAVKDVLLGTRVAIFPEHKRPTLTAQLRRLTVIDAPAMPPTASNMAVAQLFLSQPELHAIAVVDGVKPVAIINRHGFMNHYATPFFKEIHGRTACLGYANPAPRLVERDHSIDELVGILTSQDQRYLSDGFIVTENGKYVGLGTSDQLVRTVTEARIEAARHANPLTFLPGNIPISQHIQRLLDRGSDFVACYADLNHFKPFNDLYGYWRGDEMIRLLARLATQLCDPQLDFVGHVGGDDFLLVFQSEDWRRRCELLIEEFAISARQMFDPPALTAGGIEAEDRHGVMRFFPCTTLSIGAVISRHERFRVPEEVANAAAVAKHEAKRATSGLHVRKSEERVEQLASC